MCEKWYYVLGLWRLLDYYHTNVFLITKYCYTLLLQIFICVQSGAQTHVFNFDVRTDILKWIVS